MMTLLALSGMVTSLVGFWNMIRHDRGTVLHATGIAEAALGMIITHIAAG